MFIVEKRSLGAVLAALALALTIGVGAQMFAPAPASSRPVATPAAQQRDRTASKRLANRQNALVAPRVLALTRWRD